MADLLPFVLVLGYLVSLVVVSELADRGTWLAGLGRHPLAFGLALGVYATSFTMFGGVGYADRHGYDILGFYLGVALSCLCIPLCWTAVARLVRRYRLTSAADLLAFRFPSPWIGVVVTLVLLAGLMPYLSLQLRALEDAAGLLGSGEASWTGPGYVVLLALFAGVLGARYAEPWADRPGLLATLVIESLFKLGTTLIVGAAALWTVFGGPVGFAAHLEARPDVVQRLFEPVDQGGFTTIVVLAFLGAFLLPRQFHVAFVTRPSADALRHAAWTLPLLLGLLLVPLPVLLEAGRLHAPAGTPPDLYVMAWTDQLPLRVIAFLGGVSASSAMLLVTTVALSGMVVTHLLLPLRSTALGTGTVRRLRQGVTAGIVVLAVVADAALSPVIPLVDLGLVSFAVVAQLGPGIAAALWWPRATGRGVAAGLVVGALTVALMVAQPLSGLDVPGAAHDMGLLHSLVVNALVLVAVSLLTSPSVEERRAALAAADGLEAPGAPPETVDELEDRVATAVGVEVARAEMGRALEHLGCPRAEVRPVRLRRLAKRLEAQLSEMLGPLQARAAVEGQDDRGLVAAQLRALEERRPGRQDAWLRSWLDGLLQELPDGVAVIDRDAEILLWNAAAAAMTGVPADRVVGARTADVPLELGALFGGGDAPEVRVSDRVVRVRTRVLAEGGRLVVLSDVTEERALQAQVTHQARLSTVGRMASGVAHEIRNPLTGLLMVAQNLQRDVDVDDHRERLELLVSEGHRIERIVRSLLTYARRPTEPPTEVDLDDVTHEAMALLRLQPEAEACAFSVDVSSGLTVTGERGPLVQVVLNLLNNALQACVKGGRIEVVGRAEGRDATLDVLDDGPGVDPDIEQTLFEPFVTTKPVGEGTGLGLSVSWQIVQTHGGALTHDRVEGRTRFRVRVPLV